MGRSKYDFQMDHRKGFNKTSNIVSSFAIKYVPDGVTDEIYNVSQVLPDR